MTGNPFDLYPSLRQKAYIVQWVVNGGMGIAGLVLAGLDLADLRWWVIGQSVVNFIWTYTGLLAQQNVEVVHGDDLPHYDPDFLDEVEGQQMEDAPIEDDTP